jgi:hypothetical protein
MLALLACYGLQSSVIEANAQCWAETSVQKRTHGTGQNRAVSLSIASPSAAPSAAKRRSASAVAFSCFMTQSAVSHTLSRRCFVRSVSHVLRCRWMPLCFSLTALTRRASQRPRRSWTLSSPRTISAQCALCICVPSALCTLRTECPHHLHAARATSAQCALCTVRTAVSGPP